MLSQEIQKLLISIVGKDRYLDTPEELLCYSYDSFLEEALPEAVLFPTSTEDVSRIMKVASRFKIPVTARGAGTSVCGAPIPVQGGIVLCFTRMNRIIEINTGDRYAIVEPGVINGDLQQALAPFHFFFPPDPGSMHIATIGGNVAQNAGGPRCLKYGVTVDYVLGMQVVLASGKVIRFGSRNVKDVTGYKLSALFCGSEGTLGIVTEIILRVIPQPETTRTMLVTFDNLDNCAKSVSAIIGAGILPSTLELMDRLTVNGLEDSLNLGLDREAEGTLLIEVDGIEEGCQKEVDKITAILETTGATTVEQARSPEDRERLWTGRRKAYGVFARLAPDILSEDITVPVSRVPEMTRRIHEICKRYGLRVGIIAHAGDGNMHPLIPADRAQKDQWSKVEHAFREMFEAAAAMNGTLSGEHGIGLAKVPFMDLVMDQDSRDFLSTIKKAVDPDEILNPGKFV